MAENLTDTNVGNIEYIEKQDALDAMTKSVCGDTWEVEKAVEAVRQLPAADVVPVVRCKDCRRCSYGSLLDHWWCNMSPGTRRVKPDDFCSYGKRREE